jgi:hypothetical protein
MKYEPKVLLIDSPYKSDRSTEIVEVKLSAGGLDIVISSVDWKVKASFDAIWGFRVLDEGDLSEFWSICNLTHGWCFEVLEGGWNDLEKTRDHFVTGKLYEPREYLIIGLNECVSILAHEPPAVTGL